MGDVLLSRILKYLNGTLILNDYYRFAEYLINNYLDFTNLTIKQVVEASGVKEESIIEFIGLLGFKTYDEFLQQLYRNEIVRNDQIRARMLGMDTKEYYQMLEVENYEAVVEGLNDIVKTIHESKRVIIIGALYPTSISVELQTDLITFGKPVFQFHSYDSELRFEEGDYVIFISATGRLLENFLFQKKDLTLDKCKSLLITQNITYVNDKRITDDVFRVLGKFDGIKFNYQIMVIFDLIRIGYYQEFCYI